MGSIFGSQPTDLIISNEQEYLQIIKKLYKDQNSFKFYSFYENREMMENNEDENVKRLIILFSISENGQAAFDNAKTSILNLHKKKKSSLIFWISVFPSLYQMKNSEGFMNSLSEAFDPLILKIKFTNEINISIIQEFLPDMKNIKEKVPNIIPLKTREDEPQMKRSFYLEFKPPSNNKLLEYNKKVLNQIKEKKNFKVLVIGMKKSGKSSLINSMNFTLFNEKSEIVNTHETEEFKSVESHNIEFQDTPAFCLNKKEIFLGKIKDYQLENEYLIIITWRVNKEDQYLENFVAEIDKKKTKYVICATFCEELMLEEDKMNKKKHDFEQIKKECLDKYNKSLVRHKKINKIFVVGKRDGIHSFPLQYRNEVLEMFDYVIN